MLSFKECPTRLMII